MSLIANVICSQDKHIGSTVNTQPQKHISLIKKTETYYCTRELWTRQMGSPGVSDIMVSLSSHELLPSDVSPALQFTHPRIIRTVLWMCEQKAILLLANILRYSHLNCLAVNSLAFALRVRFLLLCHEALWLRLIQTLYSFPSSTWVVFEAHRAPPLNLLSLCKVSFLVKWSIRV